QKLILLGDLLADRTYNDYFTLAILDFLHESGIEYEIIFSNHDAEFVRYIHRCREKSERDLYQTNGEDEGLGVAMRSLHRLNSTLNRYTHLRENLHRRVERAYFPKLRLFSLSYDDNTLYCHGMVNKSIFEAIEAEARVAKEEHGLRGRVDLINSWFNNSV